MADSPDTAETSPQANAEYRVLARKYRPATFDELIGQDVLVRTLTNAIRLGRVHHAFILTGVRGIGKTTTARLIARALNCTGPDGNGGPTIDPCGVCPRCTAIAEDRDIDVLEIDAASNTGVDDVREIIDSARYRPNAARYKIFIVDEVHMLSRQAFNALLKTLEEPPEHVKFVFATTEIRKVPVTILSRCQRFDLRRLDEVELAAHLTDITGREQAAVSEEAIAVLARAADGSVRDGLSLLDRVIAQSDPAAGPVAAERVRALLGMADRSRSLDLFEQIMAGDAPGAIDRAAGMYRDGAAPLLMVQDLMDIAHWLTRLKLTPDARASGAGASATDAKRAAGLAGRLEMGTLGRTWQMLLKGAGEVHLASQPMMALDMLIVRLCYVAELPTPGDLVERLDRQPGARPSQAAAPVRDAPAPAPRTSASQPPSPSQPPPNDAPMARAVGDGPLPQGMAEPRSAMGSAMGPVMETAVPAAAAAPAAGEPAPEPAAAPTDFRALVELFRDRKEMVLYGQLYNHVHPVSCAAGRLEIRPATEAHRELPGKVAALLSEWTGRRWIVAVSSDEGGPTLEQQDRADRQRLMDKAAQDPLVRAVLDRFEGSELKGISEPADPNGAGPGVQSGSGGDIA